MREFITEEELEIAENELIGYLAKTVKLTSAIANRVEILRNRTGNRTYSALINILKDARYLLMDAQNLFGIIQERRDSNPSD